MVRKDKITISVDHSLIEWLDRQVKKKRFCSRSHGFEYTFLKFKEENINIVRPWLTPDKLADPGTLPAGNGRRSVFSPNGEFLSVSHNTTPFVTIYQSTGTIPTRGVLKFNTIDE